MSNNSRKTIVLNKRTVRALLYSFLTGFIIVFIIEHFGRYSYVPYIENSSPLVDNQGRINDVQWYSDNNKFSYLIYNTPFGSDVGLNTDGMVIRDLKHGGSKDNYIYKFQVYLKASFNDYLFILLFGGFIFII